MHQSTAACLAFLEQNNQLIRIKEEVDPYLEMAAIQRYVYEKQGPALLFEKVKGCKYQAASNIFGTIERCHLLFGKTIPAVKQIIDARKDPMQLLKKPAQLLGILANAKNALPQKISLSRFKSTHEEINISDIPQITCWEKDGGAFITLPQVFSMMPGESSVMKSSNLGMYRIQLSGNEYIANKEIGVHYQIHRGIGVHHTKANELGQPLNVSIFVGGNPANTVSAVMPLPEGISELSFAGVLGGKRFQYAEDEGYILSADADFVIQGEISAQEVKPEGPFGDHFGYYSLTHDFPVLKVHKVYARKNAIYPFTVVGRPPQEDTSFGAFIHELTGNAIEQELPGIKEVHAVDDAGVHPLLLVLGTDRYTPFAAEKSTKELMTQALRTLGTGQLSLAKYCFITAATAEENVSTHDVPNYFKYILERIQLDKDLHFITETTIDTLDYSGTGLNTGSKLIIAVNHTPIRQLATSLGAEIHLAGGFTNTRYFDEGILLIDGTKFENKTIAEEQLAALCTTLESQKSIVEGFPLIVIVDDVMRIEKGWHDFLWETFTKSNPAADIYGLSAKQVNKHWACDTSILIDARTKPHHAPALIENAKAIAIIEKLTQPGGSLASLL